MDIQHQQRFYLCCKKHRKPFYKKKIKERYKVPMLILDSLYGSEKMLCIGQPDKEMEQEIVKGKQLGIQIEYLNEDLLSQNSVNILEENAPMEKSEKSKYERNLEKEFEM